MDRSDLIKKYLFSSYMLSLYHFKLITLKTCAQELYLYKKNINIWALKIKLK